MAWQVMVLGAGRFGSAVARELERLGHEVLVVDRDPRAIESIADDVTEAINADVASEEALTQLGVQQFDAAVVAIGTDERSSIMATALLKRLGVKLVVSKAQNPLHGEILDMIGADRIIYPESETGTRVAHSLTMPLAVIEYFDVGPGYGLAKLSGEQFNGRTIDDLELRTRYSVTPLFLRRGDKVIVNPHGSERLTAKDELTVAGRDEQLEKLFL